MFLPNLVPLSKILFCYFRKGLDFIFGKLFLIFSNIIYMNFRNLKTEYSRKLGIVLKISLLGKYRKWFDVLGNIAFILERRG